MKQKKITFMKELVIRTLTIGFISFILGLVCNSNKSYMPYCDPILRPYLYEWCESAEEYGIDYIVVLSGIDSILYEELPEPYLGLCFPDGLTIINANISPTDTFTNKLILYHELGHCALNYGHFDDGGLDIMNSILMDEQRSLYKTFWPILKDIYFNRYDESQFGCTKNPKSQEALD